MPRPKNTKPDNLNNLVGNFSMLEERDGVKGTPEASQISYTLNWRPSDLKTFMDCHHSLKCKVDPYITLKDTIGRAVNLLKKDVENKNGKLMENPKLPKRFKNPL